MKLSTFYFFRCFNRTAYFYTSELVYGPNNNENAIQFEFAPAPCLLNSPTPKGWQAESPQSAFVNLFIVCFDILANELLCACRKLATTPSW
jgi:hypothetical protein